MRREKDTGPNDSLLLFDAVVDGGFARKLHLDEGAMLELSRLEKAALDAAASAAPVVAAIETPSSVDVSKVSQSEGSHTHRKKGFPLFRKRGNASRREAHGHHSHPQSTPAPTAPPVTAVSGPALAVVDAEPSTSHPPAEPSTVETPASSKAAPTKGKPKEENGGVKITIRLFALDGMGMPFPTRNEQTTYLHIVRLGPAPAGADAEGSTTTGANNEKEPATEVEDARPWVVKVVKREASIGPHTFHLHEIYGLTSHSAEPAHPLAPIEAPPAPDHTYPPAPSDGAAPPPIIDSSAHDFSGSNDPTAECLLCLSSPREVVLLPCRHLVACRECAVNMVEYGAGGQLVHNDTEATGASGTTDATGADGAAAGEGAAGTSDVANATSPSAPAPPPAQQRRKRKAKGWFCPVCRQPYTSLLRITTTPPPMTASDLEGGKRASVSSSLEGSHPLATGITTANPPPTETRSGFAASLPRPGFLRHFSRNPGNANSNANVADAMTAPDLERGQPPLVASSA